MKKDGEKQNCFDASIDISKVIDLSKITFTKKKRKEPSDDKENKILDKSIIKYYLQLSDNYSLFASLEKINSDFKKADNYFKLSIDICKKYEDKFSRNEAGLYF